MSQLCQYLLGRRARRPPPNTAAAAPSLDLVHPGVLRYLREIGVVR
jgi:hypothetical protein